MIVRITSCAPVRALMSPAIAPQSAPPAMPAMSVTGMCSQIGRSSENVSSAATAHTDEHLAASTDVEQADANASATPRPAAMSGAAKPSVFGQRSDLRREVRAAGVEDRSADQGLVPVVDGVPRGGERITGLCEEVDGCFQHVFVREGDQDAADDECQHDREDRGDRIAAEDLFEE